MGDAIYYISGSRLISAVVKAEPDGLSAAVSEALSLYTKIKQNRLMRIVHKEIK